MEKRIMSENGKEKWHTDMMRTSQNPDPLWETMHEGGPWHLRGSKTNKRSEQ
jgi:hypothetical protein